MSLKEFWQSLTVQQQEQLKPYLEAELAEMKKTLVRTQLYQVKDKRLSYLLTNRRVLV